MGWLRTRKMGLDLGVLTKYSCCYVKNRLRWGKAEESRKT
jgi:hypothetical protein